jgi:hypothetical protein
MGTRERATSDCTDIEVVAKWWNNGSVIYDVFREYCDEMMMMMILLKNQKAREQYIYLTNKVCIRLGGIPQFLTFRSFCMC